jgi:hypothetical protein
VSRDTLAAIDRLLADSLEQFAAVATMFRTALEAVTFDQLLQLRGTLNEVGIAVSALGFQADRRLAQLFLEERRHERIVQVRAELEGLERLGGES